MMKQPTLRKVAELAGVSLGTASQALSNKPGVLPETRARVIEAAVTLGYKSTRRLPSEKKVSTIGLLCKNTGDAFTVNPFYSYVLHGVEQECKRRNLNLMYATLDADDPSFVEALPPMLANPYIDGFLLVGTFLEDTIAYLSEQVTQLVVLVDAYASGQIFDSVIIDNTSGIRSAVEYLIRMGHVRIGLVGSTSDAFPSIRERRDAYINTLHDHHISTLYLEDSPLTREGAYDATIRLLRQHPEVTAILGVNDQVAVAAMNAAQDLGRNVPNDLSIVGFDDIDLAHEVKPGLTTVHVDKILMGAQAVRQLLDRVETARQVALTTRLSTQLIIRESVRAVRQH
jgi:LacI family transcriptional regulator